MKHTRLFTLMIFCLALAGCAGSTSPTPPAKQESKVPVQPDWRMDHDRYDKRYQRNADGSCRKRGCDNGKLFFDPGESEPSVLDIHRGW